MNTITPGRFLFLSCLFIGLVGGAFAASSKTSTVPLGDNTYAVTAKATTAFYRDVEALKAEAQQAAAQYCASLGKQMKVLSVTSQKPFFSTGYANAKVVFKALDAADPELTRVEGAVAAPVGPPPPERLSGNMYEDLLKLDDLRKRGILTDEEFQAEKKKVLARTQ